jgi:transposase
MSNQITGVSRISEMTAIFYVLRTGCQWQAGVLLSPLS